MKEDKDRPESYPQPSTRDRQLKDQPEFQDQEPNKFDKSVSNVPGPSPDLRKEDGSDEDFKK